ncbi:hypothetical protein VNO78_25169 [Psophocarpus tetragonolobus]|uniref:Uncharacterized protein n=1 Tax=Psophocarpus tetragonolobus TaxID=3891 RepID=A0AAN9S5Z1_PSOTE
MTHQAFVAYSPSDPKMHIFTFFFNVKSKTREKGRDRYFEKENCIQPLFVTSPPRKTHLCYAAGVDLTSPPTITEQISMETHQNKLDRKETKDICSYVVFSNVIYNNSVSMNNQLYQQVHFV